MRLDGKVAIVTGSSRGIGFAIAECLAKEGAGVVIVSKNKERLEKASNKIPNSFLIVADVRDSLQMNQVAKKTLDKFGRIDILVNNAGILPSIKPLHEIKESEWMDVIDVNLNGVFRITKAVLPHLMKTKGCIVNISSDAGLKAFQGFEADAYSASKGALVLLTKCWAIEYAKYGIRINCVCPGVVETDMVEEFLKTKADRDMMKKEHPLGRMGRPEEIAKAVLYFVTNDALWVTGAVLAIDGGESSK